jgi:heat-inducible transcriptional repressor
MQRLSDDYMNGHTSTKLTDRLESLLIVSIEDYIRNAVPIASGAVAKRVEIAKSSATIRNDLKTLEQMGYLRQVHTSGGRVPTTLGYRAYVNKILGEMNIKHGELSFASEVVSGRVRSLPGIVEELAKKIADSFNFPVVVKTKFDQLKVIDVMIVPLVEGDTMVLIKTNAGSINTTVNTNAPLTDIQADDASAALNSRVRGITLKEMFDGLPKIATAIKNDLGVFGSLCRGIGKQLEKFIADNITRNLDTVKLLEIPDYNDIEKIRKITKAVGDDKAMKKALDAEESVVIGAEIDENVLADSSIVKFNYNVCGENIASIGLVGPDRIDYKQLIIALYALLSQTKEQRLIEGIPKGGGK